MASASNLNKSNSNSRVALLCKESRKVTSGTSAEETPPQREMMALSVSKRLVMTVSLKLKNKKKKKKKKTTLGEFISEEMVDGGRASPSGCLSLYVKGGGCRVGACEEFESDGRRRSSSSEDCLPRRVLSGVDKTGVECFSHGVSERFWKKNSGKTKGIEQCPPSSATGLSLPEDVLEMILVRLPLASLMAARCVCKKWRYMTSAPCFLQMRSEGPHQSPWLFLFGVTRDGCRAGEIQVLDVSLDRWHRISHDALKGRSLFSVVSVSTDLYVVGGRSFFGDSSVPWENSSFKTHKGVMVLSPLTGLWRKAAPMKSARSAPVLGVLEVGSSCSIFHCRPDQQERIHLKSRVGAVSDVYEDPHRFSLRRQLRDAFSESDGSHGSKRQSSKYVAQTRNDRLKFALIAVGGHGPWDEPLESGEIYDPMTNRWIEIARLPGDFGAVCSGAVCGRTFYVYSEADRLAGYDIEKGFWVTIQTSRPPPCLREYYPKLVSCRSRLFLLCVSWCERDGQLNRRERAVRKLWELDLRLHTWNEVSRHPDAPMDWNAAFVVDRDKIYGVEMFRIFGQVLDFLTACHVSDTELKWTHISKKHAVHEADASSCTTKSMAVLHL